MVPSRIAMFLVALISAAAATVSYAQEAEDTAIPVIQPGHPDFDASVFKPFVAEYSQMGVSMRVESVVTEADQPVYSTVMIMPNERFGTGTDLIGHYARDFRFAFRRFGLQGSLLHIENRDDILYFSRLPLPPDEKPAQTSKQAIERPFFDGTFLYWILAGLPLETGYKVRLTNWAPGDAGAEIYDSPPFEVTGKETIHSADGTEYECWVVDARGSRFAVRNYVSRDAPYLIQQDMISEDGTQQTVVQLVRMLE